MWAVSFALFSSSIIVVDWVKQKILIYDLLMLSCHVNSFDTVLLDHLLVTKLLEKNQQDDNSLLEKHS